MDIKYTLESFINQYKMFSKTNVNYDEDISDDRENTILIAETDYEMISERILNAIELDLIDFLKDNNIDYIDVNVTTDNENKITILLTLNGKLNEMMKLTKPKFDTFINVVDGFGDCTICDKSNVDINTHVCTEIITDLNKFKNNIKKNSFKNKK